MESKIKSDLINQDDLKSGAQLRTHCQRREYCKMLQYAIKTWLLTLVDIQQVKRNQTKLIDFISADGYICSISWHYSVNAAEQHRTLLVVDLFKRWAKLVLLFKTWETRDIIGLQRMIMVRKMVNLKNRKYISLLFYYCPDKCVSLVMLFA